MRLTLDLIVKAVWKGTGLDKGKKQLTGLEKAAKAFATVGAAALLAVAAAAVKFAADSVVAFSSFEKGMNEVFTLLPGISEAAMGSMTEDVLAFAQEAGRIPSEVVPAIYQAISAGVPQENVFDFMKVAADAALGGVTDLETAVDGITSVVNAYGVEAISAAEASDLMFTAVKLGKTNFEQLSKSLFQVTPIASALGLEFGNVTAALATMTSMGVPTSVAATQIRSVLVELSKASSDTAKIFEKLAGATFKEFIAQGGNLQGALQLLEAEAQRTGVGVNDLFGSVEAGNAALSLTGKGTENFTNALAEMNNVTGATAAAAEVMAGSLAFLESQAAAATEAYKIQVGEGLSPLKRAYLETKIATLDNMTAVKAHEEAVNNARAALQAAGLSFGGAGNATAHFTEETEKVNTSLAETEAVTRRAAIAVQLLEQGFAGSSSQLGEQAQAIDEVRIGMDALSERYNAMGAEIVNAQVGTEELAQAERDQAEAAAEVTAAENLKILSIIDGASDNERLAVTHEMVAEAQVRQAAASEEAEQAILDEAEAVKQAAEAHKEFVAASGDMFDSALKAGSGAKTLTEQLYDQANAAGAGATELAILAAATGNYTAEEIKAAFEAALMTEQIKALAIQVAAGTLTAEDAVVALQLLATGEAETAGNAKEMAEQTRFMNMELGKVLAAATDAAAALKDIPTEIPVHIAVTSDPFPSFPGSGGGAGPGRGPVVSHRGLTDYVVPPGYEGDTAPIFAESGEIVNITPKGQTPSRGGNVTINMDLRGAQAGVGDEVANVIDLLSETIGKDISVIRRGD